MNRTAANATAAKPIAVVTHVGRGDPGLVGTVGKQRGLEFEVYRTYDGQDLPDPNEIQAMVVLGGPQSAYDDHPYLATEERYLADAVDADLPVLAICLGSQVLARALGGSAQPGTAGFEAGFIEVTGDDELAGEYFSFHSDTFTPPPGSEIVARSALYPQAWRAGSALAVQFHPEMTHRFVDRLMEIEGEKLAKLGVDARSIRREADRYFAVEQTDARRFLSGWFDCIAPARDR
ncbi:MAG TPA: type 1 glutamine amidotransferase [Aldersonia sp.]